MILKSLFQYIKLFSPICESRLIVLTRDIPQIQLKSSVPPRRG